MSRRFNWNNQSRFLQFTFIDGIPDMTYAIGYEKHEYQMAEDLCEMWPFHYELLNSKDYSIIAQYYSESLPIWIRKTEDMCFAINNVVDIKDNFREHFLFINCRLRDNLLNIPAMKS